MASVLKMSFLTKILILLNLTHVSFSLKHLNLDISNSADKIIETFFDKISSCHIRYFVNEPMVDFDFISFYKISNYVLFKHKMTTYSIVNEIEPTANKHINYSFQKYIFCRATIFLSATIKQIQDDSWWYNAEYAIALADSEDDVQNLQTKLLQETFYGGYLSIILNMSKVLSANFHTTNKRVNLHGTNVLTDLSTDELQTSIITCDYSVEYSAANRPPTVEKCIFHELSVKYNFTCTNDYMSVTTNFMVKRRTKLSSDFVQNTIIPGKKIVIEIGMVYDKWGYFVITGKSQTYASAIFGPFDLFTWMLLVLSIFTIWLTIITTQSTTNSLTKNQRLGLKISAHESVLLFMYVLATVLDQFTAKFINHLKLKITKFITSLNLLWFAWSMLLLVLGTVYKGDMFSFLTKIPEPKYPDSVAKLAKSNLMVATYESNFLETESIFSNYLRDSLQGNNLWPQQRETYVGLNKSVKHFHTWLHGLRELSASKIVQEDDKWTVKNFTKFRRNLPKNMVSLDYLKHVKMHKYIMSLFTPKLWLSKIIILENFMTTMPWVSKRDQFYPIFKQGLSHIYESGLYNKWDEYHDNMNTLDNFYSVRNLVKHYVGISDSELDLPVDVKLWRNYLFDYLLNKNYNFNLDRKFSPEPIKLVMIRVVWLLCGAVLGLSVVIFVVEIVIKGIRLNYKFYFKTWVWISTYFIINSCYKSFRRF